ncbi:MAG: cysteine hydrolase [bacterium]|nr:cysteine hydrolase [bacterium]
MKTKLGLIIVDAQNDCVLPGNQVTINGAYEQIPVIKKLLNFFREKHLDVFHIIREYRDSGVDVELVNIENFNKNKYYVAGTKKCEIVEELTPIKGELCVVKQRFSSFMQTELDLLLRRKQINTLVVCGAQYPNCIRTTIYDAVSLDYTVINITDATFAQTKEVALSNIRDLKNIGITCIPLADFISEWNSKV